MGNQFCVCFTDFVLTASICQEDIIIVYSQWDTYHKWTKLANILWLKDNNAYCKDITINHAALQQFSTPVQLEQMLI